MIRRLVYWGISRYSGGPGRAWVYTSIAELGLRASRRLRGRHPVRDTSKVKRGQMVVIEHLGVSHAEQIRSIKRDRRAAKRAARTARREARAAARVARRAERRARRATRARSDGTASSPGSESQRRSTARSGILEG